MDDLTNQSVDDISALFSHYQHIFLTIWYISPVPFPVPIMTDTPHSFASQTAAGDHETPFEHLAVRSVEEVQEYVDSRLGLGSRPSPSELEERFPHNMVRAFSKESSYHPEKHQADDNDTLEREKEQEKTRSTGLEEILYVRVDFCDVLAE